MNAAKAFVTLIYSKIALFLIIFALVTAAGLLLMLFPAADAVSGLVTLAGTGAFSGVVSFARWLMSDGMLKYSLALTATAPIPLSFLLALILSCAVGSFTSGMGRVCDFPVIADVNFLMGLRKRFFHMLLLIFIALTAAFFLLWVWMIATVPLAVIGELTDRGVFTPTIFYVSLAITTLVIYGGAMFLRVYSVSFVPSLFSGTRAPVREAFSFAGHNFFRIAKYHVIADVVFIFMITLYMFLNKTIYMLIINCFVFTILAFYLFYMTYISYASDGYGLGEITELH